MGRGKYKNKPTGKRQFSTPEEMQAEFEEEVSEEESGEGSEEESEGNNEKLKGTQGIIQIENPNLVKPKSLKARDIDSVCPLFVNKGQKLLKSEMKKKLPKNRRKLKLANDLPEECFAQSCPAQEISALCFTF
ncbi:hypothetical protein FH972_000547 [Carpinus fangiana]|uniref:Uncharacterized protein n=1 Tax=Carpinus fangiana TaxID=176857 RepID=A0A5N6QAX0_9ROSI|nr:hypothetical protein FH972_000547 [Carpinus fangiana]